MQHQSWDALCTRAESLLAKLHTPAAPQEQRVSNETQLENAEYEDTYEGADALVLETEAEDIYLGFRPCPPNMEWALSLNMDEFVDAYLA